MGTAAAAHLPVMRDRVLELLAPALDLPGALLVDATLGRAGHASALLAAHPDLSLIGIDADASAIEESRQVLGDFAGRFTLVQAVYDELPQILASLGRRAVQGVLFDLGVSSPQLDDPGRGFSYSKDAPLDMRMNQDGLLTAADVLNTYPASELARVLRQYGEERYATQIGRAIVRTRRHEELTTTQQLVDTIKSAVPIPAQFAGGHPAKRTFQALRIAVNDELGQLDRALPLAWGLLREGGVLAGISFHSLEDRRVKRFLAERAQGCVCPPDLPVCVCGREPEAALLRRRSIVPSQEELERNPRASSARLRAATKLAKDKDEEEAG
jgi:16S rRNA (cytosine1402-N4)-methyltransferase